MKYGYFDDARREYVITNPRTPVKWINYIGTLAFGGFVDHTGGVLLCKGDPTFNRITKYLQGAPASDFKGATLYLRTPGLDQNSFRILSPFFVPALELPERFECRVGLGYTRIVSEIAGVRCEALIFVPRNGVCELREYRLTNLRETPLALDAIPVVEYTHPDALKQFTNADWVPQTMQSRRRMDGELTVLLQYPFMYRDTKVNYFTSNLPAASFETDRRRFLGDNEYGTWGAPLSLQQPELSCMEAERGDNIAALLHHLGVLQPGETRRLVTQLGQEASFEDALPEIARFRQPQAVEAAFEDLNSFWQAYLGALQVETPDPAFNSTVNIHNPHQCYTTRQWSRYLSYYQLGLGARGIGIRDSSQDLLAVIASVPDEARDFLRTLLSFQKPDGSALHQFNPLTMEGSEGDSLERPDRPHYYSDDHLWLILGVCAYLKETGELSFLDEVLPFYDQGRQGGIPDGATVSQRLLRGVDFTGSHTGAHGLPLLGFADWNDTINLPEGAESLFTAHLYGRALLELIELYDYLGRDEIAGRLRRDYDHMRQQVEKHAWDGGWYVRYFDEAGQALGTHASQYGQIYLNAQSWAVLSGFAGGERGRQAMDAVYERLNTRYGIKLSAPGFNGFDAHYGGVTTYPPGAKENGGIFLHTNPWAVIAETMLGRADRAYQYYQQINPAAKNEIAEVYEVEPYVYAQNILADEHPQFGLGRNSWLSGTASWCYQAATQWILGVRPDYGGLRIEPCLPSSWEGCRVQRRFRGATYELQMRRSGPGQRTQLFINGQRLAEPIVPPANPGETVRVDVEIG